MATDKTASVINQIPATTTMIETLYEHGHITSAGRKQALDILKPRHQWGQWTSRLLLAIGSTLVLAGIIFFFAFNWVKIPPFVKLASIQVAMVTCLTTIYFYPLNSLAGKILLLSASILVGVFMAVFGQIYQTGADAYQLFMMWSALILVWTVLSRFAAQWCLWLVITNVFLILWWHQAALPDRDTEYMIYIYLTLLNGGALLLREYLSCPWLKARWTRITLVLALLIVMFIPAFAGIIMFDFASFSLRASALMGIVGHVGVFLMYRHKKPDIWVLAGVILSSSILMLTFIFRVLFYENFASSITITLLFMGILTIGLFTAVASYIRHVRSKMEAHND